MTSFLKPIEPEPLTNTNTQESESNLSELKLLVLDLNGILCHKAYKEEDTLDRSIYKSISLDKHNIYLRPKAKRFLNKILNLKNLEVAIFSSTTYPNVNLILNELITTEQRKKLKFLWCREHCTLDPDYGTRDDVKEYTTIKKLETITDHPYINMKRLYNSTNVLFIDDEPSKMRYNPKSSYHILSGYDPREIDTDGKVLTKLIKYIKSRLPKS